MNLMYLDFEFTAGASQKYDMVSVAIRATVDTKVEMERDYWLRDPGERATAIKFFQKTLHDYTLVSYALEAEARSLISLMPDLNWLRTVRGIDLYVEYRNLLNRNNTLSYGPQLLDGKVLTTTPPPNKWDFEEDDPGDFDPRKVDPHHKPSYGLAAACFKLLGVKIDTDEKTRIRDIIISGHPEKIDAARADIQAYNRSDIEHLPRLLNTMAAMSWAAKTGFEPKHLGAADAREWVEGAMVRADYSFRTARMVAAGYPVNQKKLKKFQSNIKNILAVAVQDCIDSSPTFVPFRYDKKKDAHVCNVKYIKEWVKEQNLPHWRETKKKQLSVSKDAFAEWFDASSEGFAGAYCRWLKTKQSLSGFVPVAGKSRKGVFSDFVGCDGRVRPYFNIYGSQSSRSQPGAVGFIPLKAHWMRNFIEAPPGRALASVDYASQEFLIAAIISQDEKMMAAYESGDVYMAFGKDAGVIPRDGTKKSHKLERDVCKAMVLGISYDMSARGLAPRVSRVLKKPFSEAEAQGLIDKFFEIYEDYNDWKHATIREYESEQFLSLPDGWTMWGDNDNRRSVGNFPVQGAGAYVMRRAVAMAQDAGLRVIYTLHDSLTIEFDSARVDQVVLLRRVMADAFESCMAAYGKTVPIRFDAEAWSVDYPLHYGLGAGLDIKFMGEYSSAKAEADLDRYRKFFT